MVKYSEKDFFFFSFVYPQTMFTTLTFTFYSPNTDSKPDCKSHELWVKKNEHICLFISLQDNWINKYILRLSQIAMLLD